MLVLGILLLFAPAAEELEEQVRKFAQVYALVEEQAADPPAPQFAFYQGAIPGALKKLDPHSVFFDPQQFQQLQEMQKSVRKGFGSVVTVLPGRVIVLQTLPGTPSARSGIAPGDEIIAINGYRLEFLDMDQLIALLSQSRQQEAKLDVRRPGSAGLLPFTLVPEEMQSPSVERRFTLRPGVLYLRVGSFDPSTGSEISEAIQQAGGNGLRGLVLDLRNNPGGSLEAALDTASLFLKPGQKILSIRGRRTEVKDITVPAGDRTPYEFPMAVLMNGRSASASEIVAGALQDYQRAKILGEPSFGKGLVESVFPLSSGTGLALTTAFYYTPSGRSIQRPLGAGALAGATAGSEGGIRPDIPVAPEPQTRLRMVLEATGAFARFATEFLRSRPPVPELFEADSELLDNFRVFLSGQKIQPGVGDWSTDREWIRSRLTQEILNQAAGVERGDELEVRRDSTVVAALRAIGVK